MGSLLSLASLRGGLPALSSALILCGALPVPAQVPAGLTADSDAGNYTVRCVDAGGAPASYVVTVTTTSGATHYSVTVTLTSMRRG